MDVPTAVEQVLGEEPIREGVPLKGEDALYLTPTRTIHFSAESFLSDEATESYPLDAEAIVVNEKRRKASIELDYGTDGNRSLTVPGSALDDALEPILAGVFRETGVIGEDETVVGTYRFGELTLVVTSRRLIKHVGAAVWDQDYLTVPYEDVEGLQTEQGNVASQLVLTTASRTERIKTPNEGFREVEETVRDALYDFYEVDSESAFEAAVTPEEPDEETEATDTDEESETEASTGEETEDVQFVQATAIDTDAIEAQLDEIESVLDEQESTLEAQLEALAEQRSKIESIRDLIETEG